jgi:hypothetical protein
MAMVWILLAALGVPVWLVVGALAAGLWSRRTFKDAPGVFPAKLRLAPAGASGAEASWPRASVHARWAHDVLLVHRGIARARYRALPVADVSGPPLPLGPDEVKGLGTSPVVFTLHLDDGSTAEVAARTEDRDALVGPYAAALATTGG